MTKQNPSWLRRRLGDAGRITLALAGGALFAYLAWDPKPPPPLPGEMPEKRVKTTNDSQPATADTAIQADADDATTDRVGLLDARTIQSRDREGAVSANLAGPQ